MLTDFMKTGLAAALAVTVMGTAAEAAKKDCENFPDDPRCEEKGGGGGGGGGGDGGGAGNTDPVVLTWAHSDVGVAHTAGLTGSGSRITVIDDFKSPVMLYGIYGALQDDGQIGTVSLRLHGEWTSLISSLIAPDAETRNIDWGSRKGPNWSNNTFDVVNLSYGLITSVENQALYNNWNNLGQPHKAVLDGVNNDAVLAVQAAGNDWGAAVGDAVEGDVDVFSQQFIRLIKGDVGSGDGTNYVVPIIFAGALQSNPDNFDGEGVPIATASLASYSTIAGSDVDIQNHYLVVGVEAGGTSSDEFANYGTDCGTVDGTCLYGTSFAAPIITGYAAIVGDKFNNPAPSLVAEQLLSTARRDTITGYDPELHGLGEASLANALAPNSLTN